MIIKRKQKTIKNEITITDVGLFTGKKTTLTMKGAPPNTNIVFCSKNNGKNSAVKLSLDNIAYNRRRTALLCHDNRIETIEHLTAAISCLEIDNIIVEVDGPEIPVLDGSSVGYTEVLEKAGIIEQEEYKDIFILEKPIYYQNDNISIIGLPYSKGLKISYTLEYRNLTPPILQSLTLEITPETFKKEIAPARTFCLRYEAEEIFKSGEGLGGNLQNTIILDDVYKNNTNGNLRFYDEPVRHKILDLLGDISALNVSLRAHIIAMRSGHRANLEFLRKLKEVIEEEYENKYINPATILPHRYPFLLLDRVLSLKPNQRATAIKNVTINEPYFQGHFPGEPIMPGVLQVEVMAQLAGIMFQAQQEVKKYPILLSLKNVKLRKIIRPGDQLYVEVETIKHKNKWATVKGRCIVNSKVSAEAEITFMFLEKIDNYGNT